MHMPAQSGKAGGRDGLFTIYVHLETQVLPIVYALICIASIVAAFRRSDTFWYHPLPAAILIFAARNSRELRTDMMIAASMHEHESDLLEHYGDTERMRSILASMRHRTEKKIGALPFKEMFENPATPSAWLAAIAIRLLVIGLTCALIGWCVAGQLTFLQMLGIAVVGMIVMHLLRRFIVNAALKKAIRRWTTQHLSELGANPEARSALMAANGLSAEQLPNWLTAELVQLYFAGVHPDHFHFGAERPPLEATARNSTALP